MRFLLRLSVFTITVCFCILKSAKADIVIEYIVYVEHENPLIDKSLIIPERITIAFNEKFARVQSISKSCFTNRFDLYKFGQNFYYVCIDFLGQKKALKNKKGNNYWFLGCSPCRREIPYLNEIVKKYEGKPEIQFIAIALDKPGAVVKFLEDGSVFSYRLLADGKKAAIKSRVTSYPTHFIIDQTGQVINEWHGYTPVTALEISNKIDELIVARVKSLNSH